jgi:hypothetical protein
MILGCAEFGRRGRYLSVARLQCRPPQFLPWEQSLASPRLFLLILCTAFSAFGPEKLIQLSLNHEEQLSEDNSRQET